MDFKFEKRIILKEKKTTYEVVVTANDPRLVEVEVLLLVLIPREQLDLVLLSMSRQLLHALHSPNFYRPAEKNGIIS